MIPLMLEAGYNAKGWLGMLLGAKLWHGFFDSAIDTEERFERNVDAVAKEMRPVYDSKGRGASPPAATVSAAEDDAQGAAPGPTRGPPPAIPPTAHRSSSSAAVEAVQAAPLLPPAPKSVHAHPIAAPSTHHARFSVTSTAVMPPPPTPPPGAAREISAELAELSTRIAAMQAAGHLAPESAEAIHNRVGDWMALKSRLLAMQGQLESLATLSHLMPGDVQLARQLERRFPPPAAGKARLDTIDTAAETAEKGLHATHWTAPVVAPSKTCVIM